MEGKHIIVKGIVQGVGFRPFVYNLALKNNLKGNVKNTVNGVYINIEGQLEEINIFLHNLKHNPPKLSKIDQIKIKDKYINNYKGFEILNSKTEEGGITLLSPDIAVCNDCIDDIYNKKDQRRYRYAFTNCTNCGPRFSIIKSLPYDREKTTMKDYKMCSTCEEEYKNPLNRRFHAQPTCCRQCGPKLSLIDSKGNLVKCIDEINEAKNLLKQGKVLAIKGIGGFYLVCDAKNKTSIQIIRDKKNRKSKPLALMMKDINVVNEYCYINDKEKSILLGNKKPILLLKKRNEKLPNNIAFENINLGTMLPYTPLHHLLFDDELNVLIMTSANISKEPIIYENDKALSELSSIVDYYLIHDRDINLSVDDSVVKVVLDEEVVIRNGRGYSPMSFKKAIGNVFAFGSYLKNTFSISKDNYIFMSPYIGDMDTFESLNNFETKFSYIRNIYDIDIDLIVYDKHPNLWNNKYLSYFNCKKVAVYHHHAHVVSCMFENKIKDKVIGLAFDGNGYGYDGNTWGSEFLICDYKNFKRVGHLNYMKMPGGDNATKEPWKMGISFMYDTFKEDIERYIPKEIINKKYKTIISMIKNNINSPLTSSMGRLFDGVSSLVGFNDKISFEGEACIYLENIAYKSQKIKDYYNYNINYTDDKFLINTSEIIKGIIEDIKNEVDKSIISMKFHNSILEISYEICEKLRNIYKINKVVLSGGVFQNDILLTNLHNKLIDNNFEVFTHKLIPCNDSGISIGQIIIGSEMIK